MTKIITTRRQIVKAILALSIGGIALRYLYPFINDKTEISAQALHTEDSNHPLFELFLALSTLVTLHQDLDEPTARHMYAIFMDEPWGPQHIYQLYKKLTHHLTANSGDTLDEGERWFLSHLLTTWYLGIYYHEQRPTQRITHEHALMFASLRDVLPIPMLEASGFGTWVSPPKHWHA